MAPGSLVSRAKICIKDSYKCVGSGYLNPSTETESLVPVPVEGWWLRFADNLELHSTRPINL